MLGNIKSIVGKLILLLWLTGGYPFVKLYCQNLVIDSVTFNTGQRSYYSPGLVTSPDACNKPVQVTGNATIDYKAVQYVHLGGGFHTSLSSGCGTFHAFTGARPATCPEAIITGAHAFCGSSVLSAASSTNGNGTITSYRWQLNGNKIQGAYSVTHTAYISGDYTVVISNSNNCTAISEVFTVVCYPALNAGTIASGQTINYGMIPALLTGTMPSGGISPYSYQWQQSGDGITFSDITGATNLNYQPGALTSTTCYRMIQTSAAMCDTYTNVILITVIPQVLTQISLTNTTVSTGQVICYNATQTITTAGSGSYFIVQPGGSATLIAGQNILCYPGTNVYPGGYMHGYIAPAGPFCMQPASMVTATGEPGNQMSDSEKTFFTIYPNPTTEGFFLEIKNPGELSDVKVEMYGSLGERLLKTTLAGSSKYYLNLSGNPAGIYFIRVVSGKNAGTGKIIKQ
jgi:hypothetical protein